MSYLLDTNVVSEIRQREPDARVAAWYAEAGPDELSLSVLVIGEIRQGIELVRRRGDHRQAEGFERWLAALEEEFAQRLVPVSAAVADRWGWLSASRPLPIIDALMGATALEHDLTFVTRDTEALAGTGVRLLDPWSAR